MALDRELIVRTALGLLDEVGLETLSLRRLAKQLDVNASALYWHFENKQELLDEMARAIMVEAVTGNDGPPPGTHSWDEWLTQLAYAQRRAVRSYRDGPLLMLAARPLADYQLSYLDWMFDMLVGAGFSRQEAAEAFGVISNYALGCTIVDQQPNHFDTAELTGEIQAHPALASIAEAAADPDALFERGLRWLIAGMRAAR